MRRFFRKSQRGMTLTELAISLVVIGLVSAAIWATADVVQQRQRVEEAIDTVMLTSQRIQGIYTGFRSAAPGNTVVQHITDKLFPEGVVNSARTDTLNPWNGTVRIGFLRSELRGFSIALSMDAALPKVNRTEACVYMVTRLMGTATDISDAQAVASAENSAPLPAQAGVKINPSQGGGPLFTYVNAGGTWRNVTGKSVKDVMTLLNNDCRGTAFFFTL